MANNNNLTHRIQQTTISSVIESVEMVNSTSICIVQDERGCLTKN